MNEPVQSESIHFLSLLPYFVTLVIAWGGIYIKAVIDDKAYKNKFRQDQARTLNQRHLDALQNAWGLLYYMTLVENSKSIVIWVEEGGDKTMYLRRANAIEFIDEKLPCVFYQDAAGLFLTNTIKQHLFKYRSVIYGILLEDKSNDETIVIHNQKVFALLNEIYEQLNKTLKERIEYHSSY